MCRVSAAVEVAPGAGRPAAAALERVRRPAGRRRPALRRGRRRRAALALPQVGQRAPSAPLPRRRRRGLRRRQGRRRPQQRQQQPALPAEEEQRQRGPEGAAGASETAGKGRILSDEVYSPMNGMGGFCTHGDEKVEHRRSKIGPVIGPI